VIKNNLIIFFIAFFGLISCAGSIPEPSEPFQSEEGRLPFCISLSGQWEMRPGNLAPAGLYLPSVDDRSWKEVYIPSNWYLQGIDHSGVVWFRKHFRADSGWKGKVVKIIFRGVDYTADVWLNEHYLGFHEGYFSPFSFIISDYLLSGKG
jgi:beta-mannosidase